MSGALNLGTGSNLAAGPMNQAGRGAHLDWLHDKTYICMYMKESLYREVLKRARTDLASAISKRNRLLEVLEATEKEIAQLKRLIGGIHAYVDKSEKGDDVGQTGEGLKKAVCTALRAADHDMSRFQRFLPF